MDNLGEFIERSAKDHKSKTAFEIKRGIRTDRFSFSQMAKLGSQLAAFLDKKGLKKGDRIVVLAPSMPEYVLAFFGSWIQGVIVVPIDVRTTPETVQKFIELVEPKLGFTSCYLPNPFAGFPFPTFFLEDLVEEVQDLSPIDPVKIRPDDIAEIVFTSGTTGDPKGVTLSHRNLLFDIEKVLEVFPLDSSWRILSVLPLSHAFAQVVDLLVCFRSGMKVVYLSRMNTAALKKALKQYRITCMATVPLMLSLMLKNVKREAEEKGKLAQFKWAQKVAPFLPMGLRRLLFREIHQALGGKFEFFVCGSAPLGLSLAQAWENMGINIYEGYGATEMTAGLSLNTPAVKRLGSVGKILPGMEAKIAADGEIWARGENISLGYFKNPGKTKEVFVDGWYRSGDVGFLDEDGFLRVLGRTAFKIVLPSGLKVYPEDVEKKLKSHPLVDEACVVGVKKDRGEAVHAMIVTPRPEMLDKIVDRVNRELEDHQQIFEASVWLEEDFPRTPVLKIDRKRVFEWVAAKNGGKPKPAGVTRTVKDELTAILAEVSGIKSQEIEEAAKLGRDLKLDSLARIELVSLIEEELGVTVGEEEIDDQTAVNDLRSLVREGKKAQKRALPTWPFEKLTREAREIFQRFFVFPGHGFFVKLEVKNKESLDQMKLPAIFAFNHLGPYDLFCLTRILPSDWRKKLVLLADSQDWSRGRGGIGLLVRFLGGLPIAHQGKVIRAGLEQAGDLAADGFSFLLAPEGGFSKTGKLGQFKPGVGMLAVELNLPVVSVKISPDYQKIFRPTPFGKWQRYLPNKRGVSTVSVGRPLVFSKKTSYLEATKRIRREMEKL